MSDEEFLVISGAVSGAITDIYNTRAIKHAECYYEAIRKRKDDVERIAANTSYSIEQITAVKNYVFIEEHDLGDGLIKQFYPNFKMAQSWQRLIDGKNIKLHDLTMINHELMELNLVKQGYTQDEAHDITSKTYNYDKESDDYYAEIKEHQNGKQSD